jgi:glycine cleavage system aminomethyltransferase T/glycine/D-amino acid oxidase-like deaminating enzyme
VAEKVPFLDPDVILGAAWFPTVGVVDSLRAGTIMRERGSCPGCPDGRAQRRGHRACRCSTGHIRAVDTTARARITAEYVVVIACGVWSPKVAAMAGARIPLTPAVHQMISVGPCAVLAERPGEISFPIVRDMDTFCYERQHGSDMEVGSYAHRPILHGPRGRSPRSSSPSSPRPSCRSPSDDFDPQLEQALELMPTLLGDESAEIRYAINGLLSLTPDGYPILGETPEVKGLWSAAAVWIKEGPGTARAVAEWMTHGNPEIDLGHSDIARFYDHQRTRAHVKARTAEAFNKTYGIVHPSEQWASSRPASGSPRCTSRKGPWGRSSSRPPGGSDRTGTRATPVSSRPSARRVCRASTSGTPAGGARSSTPSTSRCARPAAWSTCRPSRSSTSSAQVRLATVQKVIVAQADVAVGRVVYTPVLDSRGTFRSDLTVMRLTHDRFRVVTGGAHGMSDKKWFADRLEPGAQLVDLTSAYTTVGLWGPKALATLAALTRSDVSPAALTFGTCREIEIGNLSVLASRISYVGEFGWELYVPIEYGKALWDVVLAEAQKHGGIPVGIGVYGTTGRIEKGYRAYGAELDTERTIREVGMQRATYKPQDFIGKDAVVAMADAAPAAVLCSLTVEDHRSASGVKRYMLGGEPIVRRDGSILTDGHGHHPYVTTAGSAPSLGKHVLMAFLPPAEAIVGTELAVSYMEELYPVVVAANDATPLFDPDNLRIKGQA